MHGVINDLHDLNDLQLYEMRAAKEASRVSRVIKTASGEVSDEDIIRASVVTGSDADRDKFYKKAFGGEVEILRNGDTMEQFLSSRPSVAMQWYWRHLLARVCAGCSIPVQLAFPESIQGTVERAELDIAAGNFRSRCSVLSSAVREAFIFAIGWENSNDPQMRPVPEDWTNVEIVPPRAPNVDVGRNSAAMLAELESNTTTLAEIYGQLGKNWRKELRQRKTERDYAKSLGLTDSDSVASQKQEEGS